MAKRAAKARSKVSDETLPPQEPISTKAEGAFRPLVFVSHDSRDADLAEAFANLLTDASGGFLKSFRSSDRKGTAGIEFGAEWYNAIMGKLDDATDVVALLTANSIDRPWILYEAGVAKGKLNKQVFGVVVGIPLERASRGPFAQFQNCGDDEDSLTKLVLQLIRRNSDAEPREEAVRRQVNAFRENVTTLVEVATAGEGGKVDDPNSVSKLFEEIKVVLGDLPERLNEQLRDTLSSRGLKRRRRFHPMMIEDLMHMSLKERDPKVREAAWLFFMSQIREDFPWLYELGIDVSRAMRRERAQEVRIALERFGRSAEISLRHPIFREMMDMGDHESHMIVRHIPEVLDHFLHESLASEEISPKKSTKAKKKQKAMGLH